MNGFQSISFTVVNHAVPEQELGRFNRRGITHDAVLGTVYIGIVHHIVVGVFMKSDAFPVSADPIVGKIVKHPVETIPSHDDIVVGCTLRLQCSENVHAGTVVEVQCRTGRQCQGRPFFNLQRTVDDDGFSVLMTVSVRTVLSRHTSASHIHAFKRKVCCTPLSS